MSDAEKRSQPSEATHGCCVWPQVAPAKHVYP